MGRSAPHAGSRCSRRQALRHCTKVAGAVAAIAVSPAVALGACAAPGPSKQPVTLVINGSDIQEMSQARIPIYQQTYPNVTVQYESPPDYNAKLPVLAASGSLGDVTEQFTNQGLFQFLAQNGAFALHDTFIQRDKYDLKQFYELAIQAIRVDGKLYGLPLKGQIARFFLFYNEDVFQSRGVPLPTPSWTYDNLAEAAQKLQQTDGGQVKMWGYAGNWRELAAMIASLRPWAGDVMSPDGKKATIDTAQARAGLDYHYGLALKQRVAVLSPVVDPVKTFTEGQAAMVGRINAGYSGNFQQDVNGRFKWDMVRMPTGPAGKRGGMWLPNAMSVSKVSKHPDEAWNLNKMLCDKEAGVQLALQVKESSTPGARPDVYGDPRLLNRAGYPPNVGPEQQKAMTEPEPYEGAWNYLGADLDSTLGPALDKVTKGQVTLDAGYLSDLNSQLQAILDKPPKSLK